MTQEVDVPGVGTLSFPDGMSQTDMAAAIQRNFPQIHGPAAAPPTKYDPTTDMSTSDRVIAGVGSGMTRFARGAGNLVVSGLNKVLPSDPNLENLVTGDQRAIKGGWFSDEALREQDALDKPLSDTTAGSVGQVVGQTAASLPVSLGYGAASSGLRALPLVGRALANPLVRGGVEGAVNAASTASPDQQGSAAELGAGVGAGLTGVLGAAGRLARGFIQKSAAAQDLENAASQAGRDMFIPASQAGDPNGDLTTRLGTGLYRRVLPMVPGVPGKLEAQSAAAKGVVRDVALGMADPTGNTITQGAGQNPQAAMAALKDAFNNEYANTVKQYVYDVPKDLQDQIEDRITAALPDVDDTTLANASSAIKASIDRFASGQSTISGNNLLNAKNALSALSMKGADKAALGAGKGVFDDIIQDELSSTVPGQADLARYQNAQDTYPAFAQVGKAVAAAKRAGGQFTPGQLASAAAPGTDLGDLAANAQKVLGGSAVGRSPLRFGGVIGGGLVGGGLGELAMNAPSLLHMTGTAALGLGTAVAGGNALATQAAQRAMMGDTAAQRVIQALLDQHPESAAAVQTVLRNAATVAAGNRERSQ